METSLRCVCSPPQPLSSSSCLSSFFQQGLQPEGEAAEAARAALDALATEVSVVEAEASQAAYFLPQYEQRSVANAIAGLKQSIEVGWPGSTLPPVHYDPDVAPTLRITPGAGGEGRSAAQEEVCVLQKGRRRRRPCANGRCRAGLRSGSSRGSGSSGGRPRSWGFCC